MTETLQELKAQHDGVVAAQYDDIILLNNQKLYHELGSKLVELVANSTFQQGDELVRLYEGYIKSLETKIRPLSLSQIIIVVSRQMAASDIAAAITFLEQKAQKLSDNVSACSLVDITRAQLIVTQRRLHDAKELLDLVFNRLSDSSGINTLVWVHYYRVLGVYHKRNVDAGQFYRAAISYLAYSQVDQIPVAVQRNLSRDLGLAALTSPDIFNFGEVLAQPVIRSLEGSELSWLLKVLVAFNRGDIDEYEMLQQQHETEMSSFKQLTDNKEILRQKIAMVALIELVWNRDPNVQGQALTFTEISQATKLPELQIEMLVMKALSLKLIKGDINEVDRVVTVTHVEPRVLDQFQIKNLADKLDSWSNRVRDTLNNLENDTQALVHV